MSRQSATDSHDYGNYNSITSKETCTVMHVDAVLTKKLSCTALKQKAKSFYKYDTISGVEGQDGYQKILRDRLGGN